MFSSSSITLKTDSLTVTEAVETSSAADTGGGKVGLERLKALSQNNCHNLTCLETA